MLPLEIILRPTDFSERSEYALQVACALARDYGATLIVHHVATLPAAVAVDGDVIPLDSVKG